MKIINNELNSMPQQVEENKQNIKILAQFLKEAYKSTTDIGDSAVSIAISDTNATADTIDGWLLSHDGFLYKITSGDGTNLLLDFYCDVKGPQGIQGIQGIPGVDGTDGTDGVNGTDGLSIRFSNSLINQTIGYSTTILISDIVANDNIQIDDLIIDDNGTLAKVFFIDTTSIDVRTITILIPNLIDDNTPSDDTTYSSNKIDTLIASAGKKYYNHNISYRDVDNQILLNFNFTLDERIESLNDLLVWLYDNNYTSTSNLFYLNGGNYKGYTAYAIYRDNNVIKLGYCINGAYTISYANVTSGTIIIREL